MTKKLILSVFAVLLLNVVGHAQIDARVSQFYSNPFFYNPSRAGSEYASLYKMMLRFNSSTYSSVTTALNYQSALQSNPNIGLGFIGIYDKNVVSYNESKKIGFAAAYKSEITAESYIRVGAQANLYHINTNNSQINSNNEDYAAATFDFDFGMHYQQANFFLGASSKNTAENRILLGPDELNNMQRQIFVYGGLKVVFSDKVNLTPALMLRKISTRPSSFEVNSLFEFYDKYYFAATYRANASSNLNLRIDYPYVFALGFNPNQIFTFMVSADIPGFNQGFVLNNFYEITIGMGFDKLNLGS